MKFFSDFWTSLDQVSSKYGGSQVEKLIVHCSMELIELQKYAWYLGKTSK